MIDVSELVEIIRAPAADRWSLDQTTHASCRGEKLLKASNDTTWSDLDNSFYTIQACWVLQVGAVHCRPAGAASP